MRALEDQECFTLALYGTALEHSNIVPLMSDIIDLFYAAGQPPSHLSALARGFSERPLRFTGAWKHLQEHLPDDVQAVSLYSLLDGWHTLSDWTATCSINPHRLCFLLCAHLTTMPDAESRFFELVCHWLDELRPAYGIGFSRRHAQGPDYYTLGVSFGHDIAYSGPEYEEDLATCRWSYGMKEAVYENGILRDVYPYSLLTPRHLQRDIDGRPLWAWIQEQPQRGQLTPFAESGDYTLWTVAPEHLATVRQQLAAAGGLYVLERVNHL